MYTWVMVLLRATGVVFLLPPIGGQQAPITLRVALSACLATIGAGVVPTGHLPADPWHLAVGAIAEILLGLAFGFIVNLTFSAVELAGRIISSEIGMSAPPGMHTSLQTSQSTRAASLAFWQQAYQDVARAMWDAGMQPYLQFGEVQWWYFAAPSGMPFYDDYTKSAFQTAHGRPLGTITSQNVNPAAFPDECAFLPALIGQFTNAIMAFVRQSHADTRFEVLYPPDTNDTPLNKLINLPAADWTPAKLACFKTENFTYTGDRDLDKARQSIELPMQLGFPPSQSSHLVGIGEYTTPWAKEERLAIGEGVESVVLFALDRGQEISARSQPFADLILGFIQSVAGGNDRLDAARAQVGQPFRNEVIVNTSAQLLADTAVHHWCV